MLYCLARCVNNIEEVKYKEEWKGKKGIFWYKPTDGGSGLYVARSTGDEVADRLSRAVADEPRAARGKCENGKYNSNEYCTRVCAQNTIPVEAQTEEFTSCCTDTCYCSRYANYNPSMRALKKAGCM